jgi:hypothetical protein
MTAFSNTITLQVAMFSMFRVYFHTNSGCYAKECKGSLVVCQKQH